MSLHTTLLNGSATIINGRGINHRKLDQDERAELATDAVTGARPFVPSCDQACLVFNVPRRVLTKHLKARRASTAQHSQTVGDGKTENGNGNGNGTDALAAALRALSPAERLEVSRALGLGWVWDEMISPGLEIEREEAANS